VFERYTEHARRAVFFARYEASVFGSPYITPEHLLLGILRDDTAVALRLPVPSLEALWEELKKEAGPKQERIALSVDIPLSEDAKQALKFATEEADLMNHQQIGTPHLILGLMREENSPTSQLLAKHGLEIDKLRALVAAGSLDDPRANQPSS
jgi:ATP-dependent Clp protease ATP-binding subunit ClpC